MQYVVDELQIEEDEPMLVKSGLLCWIFCTPTNLYLVLWSSKITVYYVILLGDNTIRLQISLLRHCLISISHTYSQGIGHEGTIATMQGISIRASECIEMGTNNCSKQISNEGE